MAINPIRIPNFQQARAIVDKDGRPSADFLRYINKAFQDIQNSANAVIAAQNAADAANAAAANANAAATAVTDASALANSYPTGLTITATDAGTDVTIAISAHTRVYAYEPPTSVSVNAGGFTAQPYDTLLYIYYSQPSRAGGAVTYQITTDATLVAQLGDVHSVGRVLTPASGAAPNNGGGTSPPGGSYDGTAPF
jgi:hypothetical protein